MEQAIGSTILLNVGNTISLDWRARDDTSSLTLFFEQNVAEGNQDGAVVQIEVGTRVFTKFFSYARTIQEFEEGIDGDIVGTLIAKRAILIAQHAGDMHVGAEEIDNTLYNLSVFFCGDHRPERQGVFFCKRLENVPHELYHCRHSDVLSHEFLNEDWRMLKQRMIEGSVKEGSPSFAQYMEELFF